MDKLTKCIDIYNQLLDKDFLLTLENGLVLDIYFTKENFVHLVGLHKLTDLKQLNSANGNSTRRIYNNIERGKIKYSDIIKSSHYRKIESRIEAFPLIQTVFNKKIIVDFNPLLVESTKIKSEFILYDNYKNGYIHLGIGAGLRGYYPETFIYEPSNYYLSEQNFLEVVDIQIIGRQRK